MATRCNEIRQAAAPRTLPLPDTVVPILSSVDSKRYTTSASILELSVPPVPSRSIAMKRAGMPRSSTLNAMCRACSGSALRPRWCCRFQNCSCRFFQSLSSLLDTYGSPFSYASQKVQKPMQPTPSGSASCSDAPAGPPSAAVMIRSIVACVLRPGCGFLAQRHLPCTEAVGVPQNAVSGSNGPVSPPFAGAVMRRGARAC